MFSVEHNGIKLNEKIASKTPFFFIQCKYKIWHSSLQDTVDVKTFCRFKKQWSDQWRKINHVYQIRSYNCLRKYLQFIGGWEGILGMLLLSCFLLNIYSRHDWRWHPVVDGTMSKLVQQLYFVLSCFPFCQIISGSHTRNIVLGLTEDNIHEGQEHDDLLPFHSLYASFLPISTLGSSLLSQSGLLFCLLPFPW